MPVITGESLRDRLDRDAQLPVAEAVRIATEVAGALDFAHRQGVVHRDIKPENILLQDGHALVADFGIGKAIGEAETAEASVTATGISVGTPAYMSPEQAVGEAVDGRSDLYSLGCVLYELLVGEPPFTGPNPQAVIAKRFVQTPADVQALREGVPRPVARALQQVLQRTPIDRFETGAALAAALAEPDAPVRAAASAGPSLAVLPFASLSRDPDDESFADGITEEILNALAQIPGLRVAGRSSAFSFKGKNEDLRDVGAKLGVGTVLEGTMRRAGSRLRLTVQLVDATDGYQLWSERYDRVMDDVFALQDEIAATIAARMRVSLATGRKKAPTSSLAAYELYLKGRGLLYRRGPAIPLARTCFEQALALDANYAQAWSGLADAHVVATYGGMGSAADHMPAAADAARKAVALDPESAEAHTSLAAVLLLWDRDDDGASAAFERALAINPHYPQALAWRAYWHLMQVLGRAREGLELVRRMVTSDPLSWYAHTMTGFCEMSGGDAAAAVAHGQRACELDPQAFLAYWSLACSQYRTRDFAGALETLDRSIRLAGRTPWSLTIMVPILAEAGRPAEAAAVLAELEAMRTTTYVQPSLFGLAVAAVRGPDAGVVEIERAVEERDPLLPVMGRFPMSRSMMPHPRYQAAMARIKLPGFGGLPGPPSA
jgi:serine/threonine-protein kinase